MKKKGLLRLLVCVLVAVAFIFADIAVMPIVNPSATEVQAAETVKINKKKATLYVKQTVQLKVTGTKKKVTWSTSNKKVATVSKKGKVTAQKKGSATITAKVGNKKYTCKVTVKNPTISNKKITLNEGKTKQLSLKNATGKITWSSSDKKVATVTKKGLVKGVKAGTATITAKNNGVTLTCKVTVKSTTVAVTGVSLDKTKADLTEGESVTLKATVAPANATDKTVSWSSSDASVAAVDANGKVTAKKAGTATITATTKSGGKKATCTVNVKAKTVAVTGISLDKTQAGMEVGDTLTLQATVTPANATDKTVTWSSSDASVAAVDANGKVTAKKAGTATVTATTKSGGKKATCTITVKEKVVPVTGVSLDQASAELKAGGQITLKATVAPANATNQNISWTSNNEQVATVEGGVVKALADGEATITVTTEDGGKTADCKVTVKTVLTDIEIQQPLLVLKAGESAKIDVKSVPAECQDVVFSFVSTDESIAAVESDGTVTAKKNGTTPITVTAKDKYETVITKDVTVTVSTPVAAINLNSEEEALYVGGTFTIVPTVLPQEASNQKVTYVSSNPAVAEVSEAGLVTAKAAGEAIVTVASQENPAIKKEIKFIVSEVADTSQRTVSNQEELEEALLAPDLLVLQISNPGPLNLNIPQGDYSNISLIIDAPQGHVENYGGFKDVTIKAIGSQSFVEHATGNVIQYAAESGSVKIEEGAQAEITTLPGAKDLNLINDGSISKLTVASAGNNIQIGGQSAQLSMDVKVAVNAENTNINTARLLSIVAEVTFTLQIAAGGENTFVAVDEADSVPTITGLGRIEVTIMDTGVVDNIVAEPEASTPVVSTVKVQGTVVNAPDGAEVYLLPYSAATTTENVKLEDAVAKATLNGEGGYITEEIPVGNYFLYISENGYIPVLETLIINSYETGVFSVPNIIMVEDREDTFGALQGQLKDAETGLPVVGGITVLLRKGGNNISGPHLTYTTTAGDGTFRFDGLELGSYTVQVIDQRDNPDDYYVTTSFNATVAREGDNRADGTITRVITGDQVRFVLNWGDEESGASSDLDSHLVGPTVEGDGQFHTWYSNKYYYYNETRIADLDVDDTTWVGPETTTIRTKSNGIYSFYIHDYSNGGNPNSTQATVTVYIGSIPMGTWSCPNAAGNLWYVCDYNSVTNQFIPKNIVTGYTDALEDIGIDMVAKYKGNLKRSISQYEQILTQNPSIVPVISLDEMKRIAEESDDLEEIQNAYRQVQEALQPFTEGWQIYGVEAFDENGVSLISDYYLDANDAGTYLYVQGLPQALPENLNITVAAGSAADIVAAESATGKGVKITNSAGYSIVYPIEYEQYIRFGFRDVWAYDAAEENLITYYDYYEDEDILVLEVQGLTAGLPDNLQVLGFLPAPYMTNEIKASDREGFEKMVLQTIGTESRTYYIRYSQRVPLTIDKVVAYDAEGTNLISDYYTDWQWIDDDDDDEIQVLYVKGLTETLPENLEVIPVYSNVVTAEVKASDREGFEKMVVLSAGDNSRKYYIRYEQYAPLYIDDVRADDGEGGNLVRDFDTDYFYDPELESYVPLLSIKGSQEEIPATLTVIPDYPQFVKSEIKASDRPDFSKMVVLSAGAQSKTWYISYEYDSGLYVNGVSARDDDGNNLISNWATSSESYQGRTIKVLDVSSYLPEMPEIQVAAYGCDDDGYWFDAEANVVDSNLEGFEKMATLTGGGKSVNYYIRYSQKFTLNFYGLSALDEYGNDLIDDWDTDNYWDYDDNEYYILSLWGYPEEIPENLSIITQTPAPYVTWQIKASDREGYEKMLTLTAADGQFRNYYIKYYQTEAPLWIHFVAADDGNGQNLVSDWDTYWEYFDELDVELRILRIEGQQERIPENLEVIPYYPSVVKAEVEDSDREEFEKMVVLSSGENSEVYYISYRYDCNLSISDVSAIGYEYYIGSICYEEPYHGRNIRILDIKAYSPEMPELQITGTGYDENYNDIEVEVKIVDSDLEGFEKMATLTGGGKSVNYYIRYEQIDEE